MVRQSSGAKITAPFHFTAQNWQETAANIMKRASVGFKGQCLINPNIELHTKVTYSNEEQKI